jgi:hypothetical protein
MGARLRMFRVRRPVYGTGSYTYAFVLGVSLSVVAHREQVREEDILELENEVIININLNDVNPPTREDAR